MINLDRSLDRLAHMTAEFARIGVPFERVRAVDAAEVTRNPNLTAAETACFLSHRKCWQVIVDGADQFGAVFEDDIKFSKDAGRMLARASWVPSDADIVKLETFLSPIRIKPREIPVGGGHSVFRLVGQHLGAAGYLVSKQTAQRLLQQTKRLRTPIDAALFNPNRMTCSRHTIYQLSPALCVQTDLISEHDAFPTMVQAGPIARGWLHNKILGQFSRTYAHFRSRSFFGTKKINVAFQEYRTSIRPKP
ncbi:glycosyltransferase family 25 protein [Mesorhizobium sp. ORS 3428]|uniref:glycosyltransferase family 25 protein n=1 Tax=Mesorhizobium sp. ORS 3428 TaxID=540997 RepID=UPI0012FF8E0D|nr:glycosyltransferase family 25 protein [Mesorhizobium sp. ORS 3428]